MLSFEKNHPSDPLIGSDAIELNSDIQMSFLPVVANKFNAHPSPYSDGELRQLFRVVDRDATGLITPFELRLFLTNLDGKVSKRTVDDIIRQVDVDGDGKINYEEFIQLLRIQ